MATDKSHPFRHSLFWITMCFRINLLIGLCRNFFILSLWLRPLNFKTKTFICPKPKILISFSKTFFYFELASVSVPLFLKNSPKSAPKVSKNLMLVNTSQRCHLGSVTATCTAISFAIKLILSLKRHHFVKKKVFILK